MGETKSLTFIFSLIWGFLDVSDTRSHPTPSPLARGQAYPLGASAAQSTVGCDVELQAGEAILGAGATITS